jgi:hypothetical protein
MTSRFYTSQRKPAENNANSPINSENFLTGKKGQASVTNQMSRYRRLDKVVTIDTTPA